jgi:transcriptional regulatory protein LevR
MVYTDNDDNITDTRLKLEEETYFLDQARTNQNRWKFYNFYINAFFSSAYNVPEVMQKEFEKILKDPEEFYKWSKQLKQNLNNQFPTNFLIYQSHDSPFISSC